MNELNELNELNVLTNDVIIEQNNAIIDLLHSILEKLQESE